MPNSLVDDICNSQIGKVYVVTADVYLFNRVPGIQTILCAKGDILICIDAVLLTHNRCATLLTASGEIGYAGFLYSIEDSRWKNYVALIPDT